MIIDTHVHLNYPGLEEDTPGVLARALEVGVTQFIVPGTSLGSSESAVKLAQSHSEVWAGVGIHPTETEGEHDWKLIADLAAQRRVKAIGEVGLDYFHLPEDLAEREEVKKAQKVRFSKAIQLAQKTKLPLIIHSRDCFDDLHGMLSELAPGHPFVIHCFTGTYDQAQAWLDLGGMVSFTGIITYPKNESLREVVANIPFDRFMIETDAPYLAPQGHRGEVCEPRFTRNVAECVAEVRGISLEEVAMQTTATARDFFALPTL